eukprot:XP_011428889.1 PREDICTED: uncharacterized protein LOC105329368 isoform X2 [Crassostrea gigas]
MAQNTSDNSECLAETCRLEALEGKTKKTEDIARDNDSRKCQNTSTQETLTNSKISGKTSDPEDFLVQTHHLSLQTDETYEEQSEEQSVNLNEFPNEPLKNPNFQSEKTRDDSAPLICETLITKLEDATYSAETWHPDYLAYHSDETSEERYEEKSENIEKLRDDMSDETCNVPDLQLNHPSQNLRDPSEVISRDLKHNFSETKINEVIIVGHGKFKPTEPTGNTTTEKQTQSVDTTKTVSSYGLLILTTILILVQLYTIVFIYNMKQQYEGLELTAHNRLTGDNKITTENLLNKDNTHLVKQMNENWERILKATKEEFEKTQTITEHVLEEKRKEITLIKGNIRLMKDTQSKLQVQMDTLENRCKAMEEKYSEIKNDITSSEINFKREIYDINLYIILFLILLIIAVIFMAQKELLHRKYHESDRIPPDNPTVGCGQKQKVGGQETALSDERFEMSMAQKIKEEGISLISFSSLTQNFHKEFFLQVLVPESLPTYAVGTLSDLFNI